MNSNSSEPRSDNWQPPSDHLHLHNGLWQAASISPVSYPEAGNEVCFQVEDESFWFRHRMDCLRALIGRFPPAGTIYDIGGGNGYVASALQADNLDVVLVEPGAGARNALKRGVRKVIWAALEDARFHPQSLPAAGAFDVIEHIPDHLAFLRLIRSRLHSGGRFYCTVPAFRALWSDDDVHAGHSRRYTRRTMHQSLEDAGFTVEFSTYFFTWLMVPLFIFRTLPSILHLRNTAKVGSTDSFHADHRLPPLISGPAGRIHAWETKLLCAGRNLPLGTSLLCVARADPT